MNYRQYKNWFIDGYRMSEAIFEWNKLISETIKPDLQVLKMMCDYDNFDTMFEDFYNRWEGWYFEAEIEWMPFIQLGIKGIG